MLFVVDVGNTNIVLGLYEGERLREHWRLETDPRRTSDEYGALCLQLMALAGIDRAEITQGIMSSVVPPMTATFQELAQRYFSFELLVVGPGIKTGMPILYDNPKEVGADRVVNAIAAYERFRAACIVVDFGTATTFDCVSAKGEYLGGAICPGVGISSEALFQHASKLPRVELVRPRSVIGKNTVQSMQAGIVYGYVGLVDGIVRRMQEEAGGPHQVIATGGLAPLIAGESETIEHVDDDLTLEGLRIIYRRNAKA
jgi:type III pantothenate kinase